MPATFAVEGLGVGTAKAEFSRWGWAFREQPVPDFGIDAHVEPSHEGRPSGKLIALQIKAGPSYFAEAVPGGWETWERAMHDGLCQNCVKNFHDSSGIQFVVEPGSLAMFVCPPSKVHAFVGYPALHPWKS